MVAPLASYASFYPSDPTIRSDEELESVVLQTSSHKTEIKLNGLKAANFSKLKNALKLLPLQIVDLRSCFDEAKKLNEALDAVASNSSIKGMRLELLNNIWDVTSIERIKTLLARNKVGALVLPRGLDEYCMSEILQEIVTGEIVLTELSMNDSVINDMSMNLLKRIIQNQYITKKLKMIGCKGVGDSTLTSRDKEELEIELEKVKTGKHRGLWSRIWRQQRLEIHYFTHVRHVSVAEMNDENYEIREYEEEIRPICHGRVGKIEKVIRLLVRDTTKTNEPWQHVRSYLRKRKQDNEISESRPKKAKEDEKEQESIATAFNLTISGPRDDTGNDETRTVASEYAASTINEEAHKDNAAIPFSTNVQEGSRIEEPRSASTSFHEDNDTMITEQELRRRPLVTGRESVGLSRDTCEVRRHHFDNLTSDDINGPYNNRSDSRSPMAGWRHEGGGRPSPAPHSQPRRYLSQDYSVPVHPEARTQTPRRGQPGTTAGSRFVDERSCLAERRRGGMTAHEGDAMQAQSFREERNGDSPFTFTGHTEGRSSDNRRNPNVSLHSAAQRGRRTSGNRKRENGQNPPPPRRNPRRQCRDGQRGPQRQNHRQYHQFQPQHNNRYGYASSDQNHWRREAQ